MPEQVKIIEETFFKRIIIEWENDSEGRNEQSARNYLYSKYGKNNCHIKYFGSKRLSGVEFHPTINRITVHVPMNNIEGE